jgi:uncharacterized repeat protein (TIGR03803 family)
VDARGNLFGTTQGGGVNNDGAVGEVAKGSGTITALASFDDSNGNRPVGAVALDANGDLYGTSQIGGPYTYGTVWELQPNAVPEPSSLVIGLISLALISSAWLLRNQSRAYADSGAGTETTSRARTVGPLIRRRNSARG